MARSKKQTEEKRQVLLSVMGWARDAEDEEPDAVRLLTTGTLSGDGQGWRIDYTETQQDYESHDVVLTMDRGIVTMQRSGPFGTSMVFEQGRRFEGVYSTPYGELEMGVYPTRVRYRIEGQRGMGEVNLAYQLDLQGHFAAMHELQIRFCPSGGA